MNPMPAQLKTDEENLKPLLTSDAATPLLFFSTFCTFAGGGTAASEAATRFFAPVIVMARLPWRMTQEREIESPEGSVTHWTPEKERSSFPGPFRRAKLVVHAGCKKQSERARGTPRWMMVALAAVTHTGS